jgi:hypothetical protein
MPPQNLREPFWVASLNVSGQQLAVPPRRVSWINPAADQPAKASHQVV